MASRRRESLKPQLARIRIWVDEGRTDFWIAHELGTTAPAVASFRRANGILRVPGEAPAEPAPAPVVEEPEAPAATAAAPAAEPAAEHAEQEPRRSRRGGRRRSGHAEPLEVEGVLEDGTDGYGLWLDAAVAGSEIYRRHWAGARALVVRVEADQIVLRRADGP